MRRRLILAMWACLLFRGAPGLAPLAAAPREGAELERAELVGAEDAALEGADGAVGRPNIVLVITDDQGYGDLSCHGNPVLKTPSLDRLARDSARFTDFQVSPTCSPTRCSLMTGRHEFRSGVTHTILERERMSLKAHTLAQTLQAAGYATGVFGKWHLGDQDEYQPGRRGFDEAFIHGAGGIGQTYEGSCGDAPGNKYFDPVVRHNGVFVKTKGYCTDVFFGQALRWIDAQRGKKPFFAYITPNCPHGPLDCPPEYEKMYAGKVPPNPAKFFGMIANIDDNVGRLLDRLDEWKLGRDTLVIFMTDNGTATGHTVFNAGMRGQKGTPFRGGVRVPSFWRWPGKIAAGDRPGLAAHIDIFPTLAELTGAKVPADVAAKFEGVSLAPALRDANVAWPERFVVTHVGRWAKGQAANSQFANCSARLGKWHMVSVAKSGKPRWELFDLETDPAQKTDVREQHPEVAAKIAKLYDQWWEETLPCLENEDAPVPKVNSFKAAYWKQFGGGPEAP